MGPDPSSLALFPSPTSPPSKTPLPPPPLPSSLPPPWTTHSRALLPTMPPPPPPWAPARSLPVPVPPTEGSHFVEHLVPSTRGSDCCVADLAGVPPELLPLKKRVVRYHPYAAAWAIQELSLSRSGGGGGGGGGYSFSLHADATRRRREDGDAGLRAELLRLRISRPALVLTKPLSHSDRSRDKARLVLPEKLVLASPLLGMFTAAERRLVFGPGLPVPAFDRLGRAYRMTLRRDPAARTYLLRGHWTLYLSRHDTRAGDAVELLAFRPSAWQARLDKHGEAGLGMALLHLHCPDTCWTSRERDAAEGLLLIAAAARTASSSSPSSCRLLTTSATDGFQTSTKLLASNTNLLQVS